MFDIEKALNRSHLVPKKVLVQNSKGKSYMKTVYVNPNPEQVKKRPKTSQETEKQPTAEELDQLYFDAIKKGDMETVQRLVDDKAESYASGTFSNFEADNPCYKLRRKTPPQHTIKVYKKASTVDGQFVTLFMGGSAPIRIPIGVWCDAVPGEALVDPYNGRKYVPVKMKQVWDPVKKVYKQKEMGNRVVEVSDADKEKFEKLGFKIHFSPKGTNTKAGKVAAGKYYFKCLAYRPGWHCGEFPIFTQGGSVVKGVDHLLNNPNDVYYECEVPDPAYSDWQSKADQNSDHDVKEMPTDGTYKKVTQANKDNVKGDWFISGTMKVIRPLTEKQVAEILNQNGMEAQGWTNGNDEVGELDLARIQVNVDQTDEYKKLRDPITYDDNGQIIPLSQRFNAAVKDIRKSFGGNMKFLVKKSVFNTFIQKSNNDSEFQSLKNEIITILKKQAAKENQEITKAIQEAEAKYTYLDKSLTGEIIQKSGYPIGTVREWKGKKYKKVAPNKWRPVYNSESRGAKMSAARLIHEIEKCTNAEELYHIVLANKDRFVDANGNHLPIVDKIRAAADKRQNEVGSELNGNHFDMNNIKNRKKEFKDPEKQSDKGKKIKDKTPEGNVTDSQTTERVLDKYLGEKKETGTREKEGNHENVTGNDYAKKHSLKFTVHNSGSILGKPEMDQELFNELSKEDQTADSVAGAKKLGIRGDEYLGLIDKVKDGRVTIVGGKNTDEKLSDARKDLENATKEKAKIRDQHGEDSQEFKEAQKKENDAADKRNELLKQQEHEGKEKRHSLFNKDHEKPAENSIDQDATKYGFKADDFSKRGYKIVGEYKNHAILEKNGKYAVAGKALGHDHLSITPYSKSNSIDDVKAEFDKNENSVNKMQQQAQETKQAKEEKENINSMLKELPVGLKNTATEMLQHTKELKDGESVSSYNSNKTKQYIMTKKGNGFTFEVQDFSGDETTSKKYNIGNFEPEESEQEKHDNRSEAMKGNKNAYKGGSKEEYKDRVSKQLEEYTNGSRDDYKYAAKHAINKFGEKKLRAIAEADYKTGDDYINYLSERLAKLHDEGHDYSDSEINYALYSHMVNIEAQRLAKEKLESMGKSGDDNEDLPVNPDDMKEAKKIIASDVDTILNSEYAWKSTIRATLKDKIERRVRNQPAIARAMLMYIKQQQKETGKEVFTAKNSIWEHLPKLNENAKNSLKNGEEETKTGTSGELYHGDGVSVVEDKDWGRYKVTFDGKPDSDTISTLKHNGFRWSPKNQQWVCYNTANGEYSLKRVAEKLGWKKGASDSGSGTKNDDQKDSTPESEPEPEKSKSPKTIEDIKKNYQSSKSVDGWEDTINVNGEEITGKWKIVEADAPTASHDEKTFNPVEALTKNGSTINDRDYSKDKSAQEAVISMGKDFDSRALDMGSPIVVTNDGVVVSGNNRTMSSKLAGESGNDSKYIDALKKKSRMAGIDSKQLEGFKHPRLVFEIPHNGDYTTAEYAKYNKSGKKEKNNIEKAVEISKTLKTETISNLADKISEFDTLADMWNNKQACIDFTTALVTNGIVQQNELAKYQNPDGTLSDTGKDFVETLMVGSVMDENNIRSLASAGGKVIRQKIVRAILPLIDNKGIGNEYTFNSELNKAVDIAVQVSKDHETFPTVKDFLDQGILFGEKPDELTGKLAEMIHDMSQKDFAEKMRDLEGGLRPSANGEFDIFLGECESRDSIMDRILNIRTAVKKAIAEMFNFLSK